MPVFEKTKPARNQPVWAVLWATVKIKLAELRWIMT